MSQPLFPNKRCFKSSFFGLGAEKSQKYKKLFSDFSSYFSKLDTFVSTSFHYSKTPNV
jgi:hypothetical protein